MNKTPYEPIVISLLDVFAFFVKMFLFILIFCIVFAGISIGFHYFTAQTEKAYEKYDEELADYNAVFQSAKDSLELMNSKKQAIIESINEDPVFDLYSAQSVYVCDIDFFIRAENDTVISESGVTLYPNQEKLLGVFESLDLASVVGSDYKNDYLKQLVIISAQRNHFKIKVYGASIDIVNSWAKSIFDVLSKFAEGEHWTIDGITSFAETYYGRYIFDIVEGKNSSLSALVNDIIKQSKTIEDLKAEKPHLFHFLKFFVIGFVIGGFISVLILFIIFVMRDPVTKSFTAQKKIEKPFLGALFVDNSFFDKLARCIIGERKYASQSESLTVIGNSVKQSGLGDKKVSKIALVSSVKGKQVENQIKVLESLFSDLGYKVTTVLDVTINSNSPGFISDSDAVVIVERQWFSKWKHISVSMEMAERFNKEIIGFVLC